MPSADQREPAPRSLYAETARPAPPTQPLDGDSSADVVIVGAGFTGLAAALQLAEASRDALVVEARDIGFGASGRNGGQVNPGLKWEPERLLATFGPDLGARMVRLGDEAPSLVFDLVRDYAIACEAHRGGTIRAATRESSAPGIAEHMRQWSARGADIALLDRAGIAKRTGTYAYQMGSLDRRGGNLNPLSYARGLAQAAIKAGARIATQTRALSLKREGGGWLMRTDRGEVRGRRAILAPNGYADGLWPRLARSVIPVFSSIVATEPLSPALAAAILPGRASLYEMSALHAYYRLDGAGRFLMGGRGVLRPSSAFADYGHLIAHAKALFPALRSVAWTHCWNGRVAGTPEELPHIHEPEEGLSIALGYNGRGVAMATAVGVALGRRAAGDPVEALDLPVTAIKPIAGHFAWPLAVAARLAWERGREIF
jgi:glycine/D-amino acid oxidase-like deaminating enzyme